MEVVIQILVGDASVGVHKARVHIEEGGVEEGGQSLLYQLVYMVVLLPQRVGQLTSGQQSQNKGVSIRQLVLDELDNGHDASADLFCSVSMIIGANPQNNNLWADVV